MERLRVHKQHNTIHAAEQLTTAESSESSKLAAPIQQLQFSTEDTTQTAQNFYIWQLYRNITPAPIYTVTEPPTTTSPAITEDDMNTVEKIDTKLARMEQHWAKTRSGPFPEGVRNVIADL